MFADYTIETLAGLTGYSETYLLAVKEGREPLTDRFRRTASIILKRPDAELFGQARKEETS